jgi:Putative transposase/Transposase zinc-binding domain
MAAPLLEVADIFRQYGPAYRDMHGASLSPQQRRAMRAIELCRTAALGGHVDQCDHCGHQTISYNSCRNRHCPKCQSLAKAQWLEDRQAELLPVEYFHVVFTLPDSLAPLALQNQKVMYNLLFRAASDTFLRRAADPQHLGARIGFLAILHTWGQTLRHHPHVHCVVPAGGLSPDGQRWISCRKGFLLPVRVLSRLFRRLFLEGLQQAFDQHQLQCHGQLQPLAEPKGFARLLDRCRHTEWVVYAKPPFGGPAQVLEYLGRYTHHVAISNHRLLTCEEGNVSFRWKDYRHHNHQRVMTLDAAEFIRRFLLHILPAGFVRIRYFGWLSNRHRAENLARCRQLLAVPESPPPAEPPPLHWTTRYQQLTGLDPTLCPQCGQGRLVHWQTLLPLRHQNSRVSPGVDSS